VRALTGRSQVEQFMQRLGAALSHDTRVHLVGGATAVLLGWRDTTIDIDLAVVPESDEVFRAIARLKEELNVNIELASPAQFIPPLPGWDTRSTFIRREGRVSFYHYDFYAQALAKIERGHARDRADVETLFTRGLVEREALLALFEAIAPELYRYPAIDAAAFRKRVEDAAGMT
jgi:hypothetical protein